MNFKKLVLSLFTIVLLVPNIALADGIMIPPPDKYIYETDQKAVIFYENSVETLVLTTSFKGNVKDFAWLIPTPQRPKVDKVSDELFRSLEDFTRPFYNNDYGIDYEYQANKAVLLNEPVNVLETKQIGYYEISVLVASDSSALTNWLNKHGYNFPQSAKFLLDDYITNNWFFTAVKIIDKYNNNLTRDRLFTGHAQPLKLVFSSQKIVYPMKISSLDIAYNKDKPEVNIYDHDYYHEQGRVNNNYPRPIDPYNPYPVPQKNVGVLLYVITNNKQTLPGFDVQYAGWIKNDDIKNLAFNDNGNPWLVPEKEKYFITKLYDRMQKYEMNNDLYFRQASDNKVVNAPEWIDEKQKDKKSFWWLIGISGLSILGLLVLIIKEKK